MKSVGSFDITISRSYAQGGAKKLSIVKTVGELAPSQIEQNSRPLHGFRHLEAWISDSRLDAQGLGAPGR